MRFLVGNLYDFDPKTDYVEYENLLEIDKFALHKLNILIENVTQSFNDFEFYKYFQYLQNFAAVNLSAFYLDIVKDRLYTAGKKSVSRRATQTVLYETMIAILKMMAPVMPHQAEDIWSFVPESQKNGLSSILLADWCKPNSRWVNSEIEEKWTEILKVREVVTKAIEPLRAEKKVGSSLEVAVYLKVQNEKIEKYLLDSEKVLSDTFITSQAFINKEPEKDVLNTFEEDGITVRVTNALGEKCERCWKYRVLDKNSAHPTICDDCQTAIE